MRQILEGLGFSPSRKRVSCFLPNDQILDHTVSVVMVLFRLIDDDCSVLFLARQSSSEVVVVERVQGGITDRRKGLVGSMKSEVSSLARGFMITLNFVKVRLTTKQGMAIV